MPLSNLWKLLRFLPTSHNVDEIIVNQLLVNLFAVHIAACLSKKAEGSSLNRPRRISETGPLQARTSRFDGFGVITQSE